MKRVGKIGGEHFVLRSALIILAGLFLVVYPVHAINYVVYAIGAFAVVMGCFTVFTLNKKADEYDKNQKILMTTNAVINIVLGVFLFIAPFLFVKLLTLIIGIFIIIVGILQIFFLYKRKKAEIEVSLPFLIVPALIIAMGALVVFHSFNSFDANNPSKTITIIIGIAALSYGVYDLIIGWKFHKHESIDKSKDLVE